MRHLLALTLAAAVSGAAAVPALADQTTGTILAYDRLDNTLVMKDRTVWTLAADLQVPADLAAGDKVTLVFASGGENGIDKVIRLTRE